jgi:hypothetical protein
MHLSIRYHAPPTPCPLHDLLFCACRAARASALPGKRCKTDVAGAAGAHAHARAAPPLLQQATPRQRRGSMDALPHMSTGATAEALGVSGRIATPMVGGGFVGGGMAGRVSTPMVGHGSGQAGGGWGDHRQRTPMYRTGSASAYPTIARLNSGRASSHGRSVLDCVGEGDGSSAQVSPSSTPGHTPPLDMAARQRQMSGLGGNDSLPLWLRSDRDAAADRGGTSRAGTSDQSKPLWLQDDTNDSSWRSNGSAHSAASAGRPGSSQVHAAPMSSMSSLSSLSSLSSAAMSSYQPSVYQLAAASSASSAYMPSLLGESSHPGSSGPAWGTSSASQQAPQRLPSQSSSSGRRGGTALLSDLNTVRVGTGYSRADDGLRC